MQKGLILSGSHRYACTTTCGILHREISRYVYYAYIMNMSLLFNYIMWKNDESCDLKQSLHNCLIEKNVSL